MQDQLTSKTCKDCGETKPLDEFWAHPQTRDKRAIRCKPCQMEDQRQRKLRQRQENPEKARAADRARYQRYKESINARRSTPEAKLKGAINRRVSRAVASGKLIRPDHCEDCGKECKPHGHHEDYTKPLEVAWVCVRCHHARHADERGRWQKFPVSA